MKMNLELKLSRNENFHSSLFHQCILPTIRGRTNIISVQTLPEYRKGDTHLNNFYEASITVIPKSEKGIKRKSITQQYSS